MGEPRVRRTEKIDVLAYWRAYQYRYPELASMARDVLTIPVSMVALESAFSTSGRVLDQYRSALSSGFDCTGDWLFAENGNAIFYFILYNFLKVNFLWLISFFWHLETGQLALEDIIEDIMNLNIDKVECEFGESSSAVIDIES